MFRSPMSPASVFTSPMSFSAQRQLGFIQGCGSGNIASRHSDPKKPDETADDKHGECDAKKAAAKSSTDHPIFFLKRRAQTQKRKAAMPVRMVRECQYSMKLAPRRMMARINAMK